MIEAKIKLQTPTSKCITILKTIYVAKKLRSNHKALFDLCNAES